MELPFLPNQTYKRSQIHDQFGGNRQGGISPSARHPYIFIFSGKTGITHGYNDGWDDKNNDIYCYTGEGQVGDMRFIKGNSALRDHVKDGKRVFLFTYINRGFVRFEAELVFSVADYFLAKDKNGDLRQAIMFYFKRVGSVKNYITSSDQTQSVLEENNDIKYLDNPNETERNGLITSRIGHGIYRRRVLVRWGFRCAVTNFGEAGILIASHIVPWKEANNFERLDPENGILLSPVYDALFDRHLISFQDDGTIAISNLLAEHDLSVLGITRNEQIKGFKPENFIYLERHRSSLKSRI